MHPGCQLVPKYFQIFWQPSESQIVQNMVIDDFLSVLYVAVNIFASTFNQKLDDQEEEWLIIF